MRRDSAHFRCFDLCVRPNVVLAFFLHFSFALVLERGVVVEGHIHCKAVELILRTRLKFNHPFRPPHVVISRPSFVAIFVIIILGPTLSKIIPRKPPPESTLTFGSSANCCVEVTRTFPFPITVLPYVSSLGFPYVVPAGDFFFISFPLSHP